ncbi:MAG: phosphatase PAP2 family protein [Proteobacteria bacterium]|nr:phosphatase PAP2 family protein [Pseudomonadota bacterium]
MNRVVALIVQTLTGFWQAVRGDLWRLPLGWLLGLTAITCIVLGLYVDRAAVLWAASLDEKYRRFFEVVTEVGDATGWLIALLVAVVVSVVIARRTVSAQTRQRMLLHAWNCWFVILSCLVSGAIHHVLKVLIGRYRPRYFFADDLYGFSPLNFDIAQNSFPSGHTQTVVSICFALYLVYPRPAALYLTIAALVALSRVMLQAHYPSDVVGGLYLGICTAILLKRHYLDPRTTSLLNPSESGR